MASNISLLSCSFITMVVEVEFEKFLGREGFPPPPEEPEEEEEEVVV